MKTLHVAHINDHNRDLDSGRMINQQGKTFVQQKQELKNQFGTSDLRALRDNENEQAWKRTIGKIA